MTAGTAGPRRWTQAQLVRRYRELSYRMIEIKVDPDHPVSAANAARWRREFAQVERECERRGLFAPKEQA